MQTLFTATEERRVNANAPLAVRVRPKTLDEYFGQADAVGPGTWLRRAIEHDTLSSVILFGPAGTGKTTLARIIAHTTRAEFVEVSAVTGTVKDLREQIDAAKSRLVINGRRTILFVDEIHRFNRGQQDALLHAVEDRVVVLVGATTENPFFEVNQALLSRSRVVELHSLTDEDISSICRHALTSPDGLAGKYTLDDEALARVCLLAGGDARSALTTLELACELADAHGASEGDGPIAVSAEDVDQATPTRAQRYDKGGDEHYDVVSAFIKSMRGSDPDATLYYLARMLEGGEDPKFIARRIFISASEDVGNADPQAILVAEAAFKACEVIGSTSRRLPCTWPSRPRATRVTRVSHVPSKMFARRPPVPSPTICATGTVLAARTTATTFTHMTIPAIGWRSSTCPTALSAGASTSRVKSAGSSTVGSTPGAALMGSFCWEARLRASRAYSCAPTRA